MGTGGSTAIMFAIAAALWFLYLLPTWFRRREYLATERTATRLQQTLRTMAESAEVPDAVHVEASAREAARQERLWRMQQRRAETVARRAAEAAAAEAAADAEASAAGAPARARGAASAHDVLQRRRMRRARRLASVLLLSGLLTLLGQAWLAAATGVVPGSWVVFGAGAAAVGLGVAVQRRLNERTRRYFAAVSRPAVAARASAAPQVTPSTRAWTPVPLPKPLYLSKPEVQRIEPADTTRLLREAAARAEAALRAAHAEPEVVRFPARRAEEPAVVGAGQRTASGGAAADAGTASGSGSRFARMGFVDAEPAAVPDVGEMLRRRRSVG